MLCSTLLCLLCFTGPAFGKEGKVVNVYGWSGFLPNSVIQAFEKETGIQVNYSTYLNNEVLYAKLKTNMGEGYDVIMPSAYFINRMKTQGLLQKFDPKKLTNLKHINPQFLGQEHDPQNHYCVPFLWSSTGIVVNTKYHDPKTIQSWADLWDPKYHNALLALDDVREMFSISLLVLGYSVNTENPQEIEAAYQKLKILMPNIKLFNMDTIRSIYIDEDITLGGGWSGDTFLAQAENPNLTFIHPKEGFVISLDCLAIPKKAAHVEEALRFINFLCRPEIAKMTAEGTGFATVNFSATALLPEAMRQNRVLYPDKETMARGTLQLDVGDAAPLYEKLFEWLKLGD